MQLLSAEHTLLTHYVFGRIEHDTVQRHIIPIPVVLALFHDDAPIKRPLFEGERTIAYDVSNTRPGGKAICHFPMFHKRFRMNRETAVVIHKLQEIRRGGIQCDF